MLNTAWRSEKSIRSKSLPMQISYDPQADAIYIQLINGEVDDTLQAGKYIHVDVDREGVPLGIEILFAGRALAREDLTSITVNINQPLPVPSWLRNFTVATWCRRTAFQ